MRSTSAWDSQKPHWFVHDSHKSTVWKRNDIEKRKLFFYFVSILSLEKFKNIEFDLEAPLAAFFLFNSVLNLVLYNVSLLKITVYWIA